MGPPSYMQSVVDQNVVMRCMTVMSKKVVYKICSLSKIPSAIQINSNIIKMSKTAHSLYCTIIIYQHNHQTH